MAETLVTQYAGTVDNDNLPKLGELRFSITPAQNTNVRYNLLELSTKEGEGDVVVSVIGNGYITDANRTANLGTSKTIAAGANMDKTYFSNGTFTVVVSNKYAITALVGGTGASGSCNYKNWSFDIEQLRGMSNLTNLQFHTSGFYGDIISLSSLTNLVDIFIWDCSLIGDVSALANCVEMQNLIISINPGITGDIAAFTNCSNLRQLSLNSSTCYGDIAAFANKPYLFYLLMVGTKIYGDISAFASCPRAHNYQLALTQISGDISAFANKPNLMHLAVNNTNVSGDASSLNNLPNLTTFNYANSKVTGTWTKAS